MPRSSLLSIVASFAAVSFILDIDVASVLFRRQLAEADVSVPAKGNEKVCITPELDGEWINLKPPDDWNSTIDNVTTNDLTPTFVGACLGYKDAFQWNATGLSFDWDPHGFCRILGNRTIAMIGDSTMLQSAEVIRNMASLAGCGDQVKFGSADTLVFQNMGHLNRGAHWTTWVKELHPDIVVVSTGAHILNDANFTIAFDSVMADMEELQKEQPDIQFVWKTQNPGGGYPSNFLAPQGYPAGKVPAANHFIPGHPVDAAKGRARDPMYEVVFNHQLFWGRDNTIVLPELQKRGIPFLDVRMLYNRVDAHPWWRGDGLHYCMPGPLRVIPMLLHKLLKNEFEVPKCIDMM